MPSLLKEHILDKKILDLEDTEVEVVYDLQLVNAEQEDVTSRGRFQSLWSPETSRFQEDRGQQAGADQKHENMIPWTLVTAATSEHDRVQRGGQA